MATDVRGSVKLVFLPLNRKDELRKVWHLDYLSVASSKEGIWIKGFESEDLMQARQLIGATLYNLIDDLLYLANNKVPERSEAKGLLWSNIQKLIHLELPSFNENLFEVKGSLTVQMKPVSKTSNIAASIIDFADLFAFVDETPDYIFDSYTWCLLNGNQCFIVSDYVFPFASIRYWKHQQMFIPVGYDFTSESMRSILTSVLTQKENQYCVFDNSGDYFEVSIDRLQQLSRSSVKLTHSKLTITQ